jgi:phosphoribosylanthranilate isomerase
VSVKVKICGVRTPDILDVAAEAGADYIGLIFFPKSQRHIEPAAARALVERARGKVKTVAVLVDPDDAAVDRVAKEVGPDFIQLHGGETPERAAAIKARSGLPIIKAISVETRSDAAKASAYRGIAELILFDAKGDPAALLPGGNGVVFDWTALASPAIDRPFALSGGLNPANVGEAIAVTGASMVDVSSGVERAPGDKDAGLVRDFIRAAKSAGPDLKAKAS